MYTDYFGLRELPFSISPDPRYLYMSERHREAMAHLSYGLRGGGGFVQLTGEIGTGKTTLCRCMLLQLPEMVDVAVIMNPRVNASELIETICDELQVTYPDRATPKQLHDCLNKYLLDAHAKGRRTALIIDEAQNLPSPVLEQIRLLTNLETSKEKLLQIILIGQPELSTVLNRPDLRQLAQRITARYHLLPLSAQDTREYIRYRLTVAGRQEPVFTRGAMRAIYRVSGGVPRLINVVCDRALLGAYSNDQPGVVAGTVRKAASEVFGERPKRPWGVAVAWVGGMSALASVGLLAWWMSNLPNRLPTPQTQTQAVTQQVMQIAADTAAPPETRPAAPPPVQDSEVPADSETRPAAIAPPGPELGQLLNQLSVTSSVDALAELAGYWGVERAPAQSEFHCQTLSSLGLECVIGRGTWNNLRSYNRVALLTLRDDNGASRQVLVTEIADETVTLSLNGQAHRFPISRVDRRWYGDYLLLWRPPPLLGQIITPGIHSSDVKWLRRTINLVAANTALPPLADADSTRYDADLQMRVRDFQRRHALKEDGIVGTETLIRLNAMLHPNSLPLLLN